MDQQGTKKVIYAALIGNLLVAITKFAAALFTGSSAMFSEAVHSMVDTSNELVLIYGVRRGTRPPDEAHPFGHGRELYFWSFIVTLLIFTLGAGVSMYEGINHVYFVDSLSAADVEQSMMTMEARVKALHPQIMALLIRLSKR